jgi:hypothetical protein
MRLFNRKDAEENPRCPECHEFVIAGSAECEMCGHKLAEARDDARFAREAETETARQA